ncbi:hypothetical protein ACLSU7_14585 [Bdellovibrio sp. HCB185ZH]|uniref:hypothetical protein n=1 Tax=Bdellovibrio sp. HCB185ZH TaxID=3394235 RepID=UPI0039A531AA
MTTIKYFIVVLSLLVSAASFAAPRPGFKLIGPKAVTEDNVKFRWMSNDGEIILNCSHVYDRPDAWDWDVWCGKGTKMFREFRVHFLVQEYNHPKLEKKAFQVLYWVTDRNSEPRKFDSMSQWLQFNGKPDVEYFSFSVGVENDYGILELDYRP